MRKVVEDYDEDNDAGQYSPLVPCSVNLIFLFHTISAHPRHKPIPRPVIRKRPKAKEPVPESEPEDEEDIPDDLGDTLKSKWGTWILRYSQDG